MTSGEYQICFYDRFRCLAGDCPASCCRGWNIPLDEKAMEYYRKVPGILGLSLRIRGIAAAEPVLALSYKECEYHDRDGLCILQKKLGEEGLPEVCRQYPRITRDFGDFRETCLDLSCIHAAELFLGEEGRTDFAESRADTGEDDFSGERHGNNDDKEYLESLYLSRKNLIRLSEELRNEADVRKTERFFSFISRYALRLQNEYARGNAVLSDEDPACFWKEYEGSEEEALFSFTDQKITEELFYGGFYHPDLKRQSPFLYQLCLLALKGFRSKQAGSVISDYLKEQENALSTWIRYYEYTLCQYYFNAYEDYSFTRWMLTGFTGGLLILLFCALYAKEKGGITTEEKAHIISVCERRIRHNHGVFEKLDRLIRDYFFGSLRETDFIS